MDGLRAPVGAQLRQGRSLQSALAADARHGHAAGADDASTRTCGSECRPIGVRSARSSCMRSGRVTLRRRRAGAVRRTLWLRHRTRAVPPGGADLPLRRETAPVFAWRPIRRARGDRRVPRRVPVAGVGGAWHCGRAWRVSPPIGQRCAGRRAALPGTGWRFWPRRSSCFSAAGRCSRPPFQTPDEPQHHLRSRRSCCIHGSPEPGRFASMRAT